ncbi:hypothetical protein BaRGS_00038930, partial [Batillaria attramentaria]
TQTRVSRTNISTLELPENSARRTDSNINKRGITTKDTVRVCFLNEGNFWEN